MYDYLFSFDDISTAQNALSAIAEYGEHGWLCYDPSHGILPVSIITKERVINDDGDEVSPPESMPGYYMVLTSNTRNAEFYDIAYCLQETLRPDIPTPVSQTVVQTKLTPEQYQGFLRVDPVFSGALYVWGA